MVRVKNERPDFVGLENLKKKHGIQIELFERWARARSWMDFHNSHYDWWTFPIDQPSRFGYAYTVYEEEINELRQDPVFIKNYLRGVELLLLSLGWDLHNEKEIEHPDPGQAWSDWPIRLFKCAQSMSLFGYERELRSVQKFGQLMLDRGADFSFRGKDLKTSFLNFNTQHT